MTHWSYTPEEVASIIRQKRLGGQPAHDSTHIPPHRPSQSLAVPQDTFDMVFFRLYKSVLLPRLETFKYWERGFRSVRSEISTYTSQTMREGKGRIRYLWINNSGPHIRSGRLLRRTIVPSTAVASFLSVSGDGGNVNCQDCKSCSGCVKCQRCTDCSGCVKCVGCENCDGCVKCTNCTDCHGCVNCSGLKGAHGLVNVHA